MYVDGTYIHSAARVKRVARRSLKSDLKNTTLVQLSVVNYLLANEPNYDYVVDV